MMTLGRVSGKINPFVMVKDRAVSLQSLPERGVSNEVSREDARPRRGLSRVGLRGAFRVTLGMLALAIGVGAVAASSNRPAGGMRARAAQLAAQTGGDFSESGVERILASMDPAMVRLVQKFDPAPDQAQIQRLWRMQGAVAEAPPPGAEPEGVAPVQAMAINAAIPFSILPNPAARPFLLKVALNEDRERAVQCLTAAVYYEAAFESDAGQAAVAQVVLNRMRHPLFPKSVCGVVFQGSQLSTGCQFTFTCDGALNRMPSAEGWARARKVALRALNGYVMPAVGQATHYHAVYVFPYWAPSLVKLTQIGAHIFYRWNGSLGMPGAFTLAYAGTEAGAWDMAGAKLIRISGPVSVEVPVTSPSPSAPEVQVNAAPVVLETAPAAEVIQMASAPLPTLTAQPAPQLPVGPARAARIAAPSDWR